MRLAASFFQGSAALQKNYTSSTSLPRKKQIPDLVRHAHLCGFSARTPHQLPCHPENEPRLVQRPLRHPPPRTRATMTARIWMPTVTLHCDVPTACTPSSAISGCSGVWPPPPEYRNTQAANHASYPEAD